MTVITGPLVGITISCAISPDALKNFAPAAGQLMALAFAVAICYPLTLLGLKMEEVSARALKQNPAWIKKALACNAVVKKIASASAESAAPAVIKRIVDAANKKLPRATPPNADAELGGEDEVTPAQFERFRSDANALYRSVGAWRGAWWAARARKPFMRQSRSMRRRCSGAAWRGRGSL